MPVVSYDVERPDDITDRKHRQWMNLAHRVTMENHRDKRMKKHFRNIPETRPGGEYGYAERSAKYLKRKGHRRPNVLTGQTKEITETSRIRATFKNATMTIRPNFQGRAPNPVTDAVALAMLRRGASQKEVEQASKRWAKFLTSTRHLRKGGKRGAEAREQHAQRIKELEAITNAEREEIGAEMLSVYNGQLEEFRRTRKRRHVIKG